MSAKDKTMMRLRARASAKRFNEEEFAKRWLMEIVKLVSLSQLTKLRPNPWSTQNFSIALGYIALLSYDVLQLVRSA